MTPMTNNIILEDGYNTDYIYSVVTALFYTPTDGANKILNTDGTDINSYYVQEYIKSKFIYQIHRNISIDSVTINKFRMFLYNCGWLSKDILFHSSIDDFYTFLVYELLNYKIMISFVFDIEKIDSIETKTYDMIKITSEYLDNNTNEINNKIVNLSDLVKKWMKKNVTVKKHKL